MGAVIEKVMFKSGKEPIASTATSLWEIGAKNIDG